MSAQKTAESAAQKYWIDENNGPLGNMKDNGPDQPGPRIIAVTQVAASQEVPALASLKIFCVEMYNPMSRIAGPGSIFYTLILKDDQPSTYLHSDEELTKAIESLSQFQLKNLTEAKAFAKLFAEARGYQWRDHKPEDIDHLPKDFTFEPSFESSTDGAWTLLFTVLKDPATDQYVQFKLTVSKIGKIQIEIIKSHQNRYYS